MKLRRLAALTAALLTLFTTAAQASNTEPMASWQTNGTVRDIVFSGGVVYFGGEFTSVRPPGGGTSVTRNHAAAIDANTGQLLPWNPDVNGRVMAIDADSGSVYLGGQFSKVGGQSRANVAAVSKTSGSVQAWSAGTNSEVDAITATSSGVFLGGHFSSVAGHTRHRIALVSLGGTLQGWSPDVGQVSGSACPPRCSPWVSDVALSGSTVYFGGHFGRVSGALRDEAAAVTLGGSVTSFNPDIYASANCPTCQTVETSRVYTIIPTSRGVFTCGGYWKVNGTEQSFNISLFDSATGRLDRSFNGQDDGDTPGCTILNDVLYAGGHFNVAGPDCRPANPAPCATRHHLAAFNTTGQLYSWNPVVNSPHGVFTIAHDSGHIAVGGFFTRIGGRDQQGIAIYPASSLP